jgi:hypothetical protein
MSESTRRGFLIMAGAGAAATAGVAVVASKGKGSPAEAASTDAPAVASGPVVAYVQDVRSGRVSVMVGETEVVVRDPELVARLARHAAGRRA